MSGGKEYFEQCPDVLEGLQNNKKAWAFEHTKHSWKLAEDAGFKFKVLVKCGMFHEPIWKDAILPQKNWDFKYTYRVNDKAVKEKQG